MNLKTFNFNFKPKFTIRLNNGKNELYTLLVRVYGSCLDVTRIEIPNYSSVTTISVNCSNVVYEDILAFLYGKGYR